MNGSEGQWAAFTFDLAICELDCLTYWPFLRPPTVPQFRRRYLDLANQIQCVCMCHRYEMSMADKWAFWIIPGN